jgi:hypothetical protein
MFLSYDRWNEFGILGQQMESKIWVGKHAGSRSALEGASFWGDLRVYSNLSLHFDTISVPILLLLVISPFLTRGRCWEWLLVYPGSPVARHFATM